MSEANKSANSPMSHEGVRELALDTRISTNWNPQLQNLQDAFLMKACLRHVLPILLSGSDLRLVPSGSGSEGTWNKQCQQCERDHNYDSDVL